MKRAEVIKAYNKLKETHDLPTITELENEFEFQLDETYDMVKEITNQIWDKIGNIKLYIEGILNPQRYCCMLETNFLNKKSKERVYNIYKKIMIEYWKTAKTSYQTPKERAARIKNDYEFYKKIKKFATDYCDKMIEGWSEEEKETKEDYIN